MDQNIRTKTLEFLEENIIENLHDLRLGKEFLDVTPKVQFIKEKK